MGPGRRQRRRGSFSRRWYFVARRDGGVRTMATRTLGPRGAGGRTQFERRRGRHIATLDRRKIADRKPLIGTQIGFEPRLFRRRGGHWLRAFGGRSGHSEGVAVCCTMAIVAA